MDCLLRHAQLCFVQLKFEEFYIVVSLFSPPFQHDRWPCDHLEVVLLHMRESPHLGVRSYSVHHRIFKMLQRKPRSLMKPTRNEITCFGTFPFTTCRSRQIIPAVSAHQNWKACLRFPVSENRIRTLRLESSFLFPLLPTVQFDVVHQHFDLRHKQHTDSCRQHVLNLHVLVDLCSLDSLDSF